MYLYVHSAFTTLKSYYSSHSLRFMKKRLSDTDISKGSFLIYYYVRRSTSFLYYMQRFIVLICTGYVCISVISTSMVIGAAISIADTSSLC